MRNILLTILTLVLSTMAMAQVKVEVKGICPADLDTVYMYDLSKQGVSLPVKTHDGKFEFSGEEDRYMVAGVGTKEYYIPFFVDGTPVEVDLVEKTLKGSELNELVLKTDLQMDEIGLGLREEFMKLSKKAEAQPEMMEEIQNTAMKLMIDASKKRVKILEGVKSTMIPAVYLPDMYMDMTLDELTPFLAEDAPYYNHPRMAAVKHYATGLEKKRPGKMFVDLTMNDLEGNPHSLSEWCGKGNYVLVDFWASWCGPCRQEMPNVVESYVKYHDKGYEIVGVSFDNKAEPWKAAVQSLGMTWKQISDLKGWQSAAADAYGIMAIPSNVLLGPDGRIVACDLRGEGLQAKLKEIYGF